MLWSWWINFVIVHSCKSRLYNVNTYWNVMHCFAVRQLISWRDRCRSVPMAVAPAPCSLAPPMNMNRTFILYRCVSYSTGNTACLNKCWLASCLKFQIRCCFCMIGYIRAHCFCHFMNWNCWFNSPSDKKLIIRNWLWFSQPTVRKCKRTNKRPPVMIIFISPMLGSSRRNEPLN